MENRLVEIEIKMVSLEDTVQSLNATVYEQQKQLDELRALCRLLVRRLDDPGVAAPGNIDERPPHY